MARGEAGRTLSGEAPRLRVLLLAATLAGSSIVLSGCADQPPAGTAPAGPANTAALPSAGPAAPAPPPAAPAPTVPWNEGSEQVASAGKGAPPPLPNDPSAPADTPLCGLQAREAIGISRALLPGRDAEAGECASFACYDPATATYLGADGYHHVCR